MSTYLSFRVDTPAGNGRKTDVWGVYSKGSGFALGRISWFGRWRQYTFFPLDETTFNPDCLRAIADRCDALTKAHRAEARAVLGRAAAEKTGE